MGLLLLITPAARPSHGVLAWLAVAGSLILLRSAPNPPLAAAAATTMVAAAAMACAGAGGALSFGALPSVLAWGLVGAGLLSTVLAMLQYFGFAEALFPWMNAPEPGHAYGGLRQRNQLATLLSMGLVATLWLQLGARGGLYRAAWGLVAALLIFAIAASTSRTGLLQLLLISGVSSWLAWRERLMSRAGRLPSPLVPLTWIPVYFLAAWLLPLLAGGGVETMGQRLREGAPLAHSRLILWHNVLGLIAQRPWQGWGWGELAFAHYSTLHDGLRFAELLDNAHNLPLHLAVELGIPAALLICTGFGWLALSARPWRETDPARLMVWGLLGLIVLHSLLEYPLWYGPFQLVFGLCLGFLWPSPAFELQHRRTALVRPLAALALMSAVGYAAWDYTRISQLYLAREDRLPAWRDDTLAKVQDSWLFANQVKFAELALMPVNAGNAAETHALAQRLLHFSPEPRVIAKLIDGAQLLGLHDEALAQAARFRVAFPREYARWLENEPIDDPAE
ncbi:polymerase [Variovorax sp. JS1663]|nr:Wzy polymerase domain-containing protein [Variovorax sp. JS1663]OUM03845.1 polymerase [Variovorax sp. JS1663]